MYTIEQYASVLPPSPTGYKAAVLFGVRVLGSYDLYKDGDKYYVKLFHTGMCGDEEEIHYFTKNELSDKVVIKGHEYRPKWCDSL